MLIGGKNLKDSSADLDIMVKDSFVSISYTKTNKLITALYMVTDIIDTGEPLRNKLRTLGTEILSGVILASRSDSYRKIEEVLSFLDIASAVSIISEMNCNILRKEFLELSRSLKEAAHRTQVLGQEIDLSKFFKQQLPSARQTASGAKHRRIARYGSTRIGVQKGDTLMKALSDKTSTLSDTNSIDKRHVLDILKGQRRIQIRDIINNNGGNSTIKDIKTAIGNSNENSPTYYSQKTLQRELMSMIKDGILNKTGDKRWSRYHLTPQTPQ